MCVCVRVFVSCLCAPDPPSLKDEETRNGKENPPHLRAIIMSFLGRAFPLRLTRGVLSAHPVCASATAVTASPSHWGTLSQSRFLAEAAKGAFLPESEVRDRVMETVKAFEKVDPARVTATSHFANDLGLDSLDSVEVVMGLEDEFAIEIPDADADKILSIPDAIKYITSNSQAK